MRYFDPANFAPMIKVPVYMSCGFIDTCCQPSGVYAVYNELQGNKMIFNKTCHGHGGGPEEYTPLFWFWTACHLGLCKE
jgi:cephalosporin-C deacetylase